MKQSSLAKWLKLITIGLALAGAVIYLVLIPMMIQTWVNIWAANPTFVMVLWLAFLWLSGVPCYISLFYFWKICVQIENDNSFSYVNATSLKQISKWMIIDTVFFFSVNVIYVFVGISRPEIAIMTLFIDFAGVAVAVAAITLAHLVYKAADMSEENRLTI